jgi:hypothetical protein
LNEATALFFSCYVCNRRDSACLLLDFSCFPSKYPCLPTVSCLETASLTKGTPDDLRPNLKPLMSSTLLSGARAAVELQQQFAHSIETAADLKQLLLDLSKASHLTPFARILREAAENVRTQAFGYNRAVTRKKILKALSEFDCLEMDDLVDETRLPEVELLMALEELIVENVVTTDLRRRWQEPGRHYNVLYLLKR